MPSAYTEPVRDGTLTDFPTFALRCARSFGALYAMRDEPLDAPLPERFEPSTDYHDRRIAEAQAELDRLEAMSYEDKVQAAALASEEISNRIAESNAKSLAIKQRYMAMLEQVRAWEPPTSDHIGLKDFMFQQLEESISWDCYFRDMPEPYEPNAFWLEKVQQARRSLDYYTKARDEEIQRARERTAWLRHLRDSLEPTPVS